MRLFREPYGMTLLVGPWCCRINWHPAASFGWMEGDGPIVRFVRKWWSGCRPSDERVPEEK